MAIVSCGECNKEISDTAPACPHCGAKKSKSYAWLYIMLGVPAAFLIFGAMQPSDPERSSSEDAIKECWKEQGRKSNSAGTAQFVAGACEMMESKYSEKYGRRP